MNATPPAHPGSLEPALVDLVDFKWLMVHEGHEVHLDRMQHDPAYARERLALAAASPTVTLRRVAERLRGLLPPTGA
jgi:hypothetical protein